MRPFRLELPSSLQQQLDALPASERRRLWGDLLRALEVLDASSGARGHGERVEDLLPPMFILTSREHRLLYEVDGAAGLLVVRALQARSGSAPRASPAAPPRR
jgi:hypothetical protein